MSLFSAPIGLGFQLQLINGNFGHEGLVAGGDHHDAALRDHVAAAIFFRVEPDRRAARNVDIAIDDGPADARVPADAHARHQDRLLDLAEAVHAHVRTQDAAVDAAVARLRPILMTTLATTLGALLIALAVGSAGTSRVPLGIVIVGGMLFALVLTLYVVPALYSYMSSKKSINKFEQQVAGVEEIEKI